MVTQQGVCTLGAVHRGWFAAKKHQRAEGSPRLGTGGFRESTPSRVRSPSTSPPGADLEHRRRHSKRVGNNGGCRRQQPALAV
jgi:hypothetical protein